MEVYIYIYINKRKGTDGRRLCRDGNGVPYARVRSSWYIMRSNVVMISRLPGYPLATRMSSTRERAFA